MKKVGLHLWNCRFWFLKFIYWPTCSLERSLSMIHEINENYFVIQTFLLHVVNLNDTANRKFTEKNNFSFRAKFSFSSFKILPIKI